MNESAVTALIAGASALGGSFITLLFAHLSSSRAAKHEARREDLKHERQEIQRRREANERRLESMMTDLSTVADRLATCDMKNQADIHFPDPSDSAAAASGRIHSAAVLYYPEMRAAAYNFHHTNVLVEAAIVSQDKANFSTANAMWERDITLLKDAIAAASARYQ